MQALGPAHRIEHPPIAATSYRWKPEALQVELFLVHLLWVRLFSRMLKPTFWMRVLRTPSALHGNMIALCGIDLCPAKCHLVDQGGEAEGNRRNVGVDVPLNQCIQHNCIKDSSTCRACDLHR